MKGLKMVVKKTVEKVVGLCRAVKNWIWTRDLGIVWIILLILAIIVAIALIVGLVIGFIIGIPALILFLAWNWVIPVFGGPAIGYWTAVGLTILIDIVAILLKR